MSQAIQLYQKVLIQKLSVFYLGFARNYLMHGLNRLTDPRPAGSLPHLQVIDLSW